MGASVLVVGSLDAVALARLLAHAQSSGFGVAQHVVTRDLLLISSLELVSGFPSVASAREWLRRYAECGMYGRRCFSGGHRVCVVHGEGSSSRKGGVV